jgi:muramoyltetrapeptide carboxypeptidase
MRMPSNKPAGITNISTVGVIAPASGALDEKHTRRGVEALEARGLTVILDTYALHKDGYLAASDSDRATALNAMIANTGIDAIFCLRGGYGSMRILEMIDYDTARRTPKLLVGYSDITALHCALYSQAGWAGLHGPMVAVDWHDIESKTEEIFWNIVGGKALDPLPSPDAHVMSSFRSGVAEGQLIGGNLSMLVRLLGTPFFPDMRGAILFLEDVGERPYRLDAMFAQLKLAGVLDVVSGVAIGAFTDCEPARNRSSLTFARILADYFGDAPYPISTGLRYGHIPVKTAIPFGTMARLDCSNDQASLSMLEPLTLMNRPD